MVDSSLSDYVTKLGGEEVLLSSVSLETRQAIEDQVAQLYGDPHDLWRRLHSVLGPVSGSEEDLHRLRQAMKDGQVPSSANGGRSPAVLDPEGQWSYQELWHFSGRLAQYFKKLGLAPGDVSTGMAPRPIAVFLPPGRVWYSACVAAWRLGIPVLPLEENFTRPEHERRASRAFAELRPQAVVSSDVVPPSDEIEIAVDCVCISLNQLKEILSSFNGDSPMEYISPGPDTVLCYVYTGGTTRHSKCVAVTHGMALWEVENYAIALQGLASSKDRMLQYSGPYWGAAVFGQMDLALAFGACNVICYAGQPEDIASACSRYDISILGIVPSQLRGAFPAGPKGGFPKALRMLVTWAERTPPKLAKEWRQEPWANLAVKLME
eukprot:symbB.v1.2.017205.t1/scaffold1336.1/size124716/3